jgi:demethylmenaquinone methyltransferase / 2-methoxy-6-polyprenyl-1,4-benzoquinol methylase
VSHAAPHTKGRLSQDSIEAMFDRIAPVYDAMNSLMTAGLDRRWRERAIDLAHLRPGMSVIDVATGTGDLAEAAKRRVGESGQVVGSDVSEQMLARARRKAPSVRFERGDALALEYDADSFDAATVGFGARNFGDLGAGLAEMARVVRPGGRVVCLEITTPRRPPLSWFFRIWFDLLIPRLGAMSGNSGAYSYLPASVKRFPDPMRLCELLEQVGLCDIRYVLTAGGIIALHVGTVGSRE